MAKRHCSKHERDACSSVHNALVWPLPPELTINVFSMTDTQSVCTVAATCLFFHKCAMDPLCFANIDFPTLLPKINHDLVSTLIQRAGNALRSIKLGVPPPCHADATGFPWNDKRSRQGKDPFILATSCMSSLSADGGAPGSGLKRLHLYNIRRMDNPALLASLSVCPSLFDLEIVGVCRGLEPTLKSLSSHCPLLERFIFKSVNTVGHNDMKDLTFHEFVLNCPNITSLALKGFTLRDSHAHILVKGFHKLKYVDFSRTYRLTGSFLKNLGTNGGGNQLEVMILRDPWHLKQVEVKQFITAVLAGDVRLLRHLDISNIAGLVSPDDDNGLTRSVSTSFIPKKKLLEQRPNFCLVAEFPDVTPV